MLSTQSLQLHILRENKDDRHTRIISVTCDGKAEPHLKVEMSNFCQGSAPYP